MDIKIFKGIERAHYTDNISGIKGIVRLSFLEKEYIKGKSFHIAAHIIDGSYIHKKEWSYSHSHKHDFDEIIMLKTRNKSIISLFNTFLADVPLFILYYHPP